MNANEPAYPTNYANVLTKRELFAAMIAQGMASNVAIIAPNAMCGWGLVNCTEEQFAHYAIAQADTLLAELEKSK